MVQQNSAPLPGGVKVNTPQREVYTRQKKANGVVVWKSKNPKTSDSHVALYKFNDNGKLVIACFTPDKVEDALKTLEYFHYKDAQDLINKKVTIEEYAAKIGFDGSVEDVQIPTQANTQPVAKSKKGKADKA